MGVSEPQVGRQFPPIDWHLKSEAKSLGQDRLELEDQACSFDRVVSITNSVTLTM